jgi:hypothetical protein
MLTDREIDRETHHWDLEYLTSLNARFNPSNYEFSQATSMVVADFRIISPSFGSHPLSGLKQSGIFATSSFLDLVMTT